MATGQDWTRVEEGFLKDVCHPVRFLMSNPILHRIDHLLDSVVWGSDEIDHCRDPDFLAKTSRIFGAKSG